jgi:pimeloyl-ACP methyl ester carboxylesterase
LDSAELSWGAVRERLAEHANVVSPNLPGYGGAPVGQVEPTLGGYSEWLTELLDAEEIDRVVIVGLSLGGGVALRTALDVPSGLPAWFSARRTGSVPTRLGGGSGT